MTTTNDTALWTGSVNGGPLLMVAREGSVAVGTQGAMFGASFSGSSYAMNGLGQLLFTASLNGGDVVGAGNDSALFVWDTYGGLNMVFREGMTYDFGNGDVRTISGWTYQSGDNGAGGSLGFNDSGVVGLRMAFTDGTDAVVRLTSVPGPGALAALGLGLMAGLRRRR